MQTPQSRRDFLTTGAVALAAASAGQAADPPATLRVGLIGCGGRGTGAASQALRADPNVKLVSMGDVFPDRLQLSLSTLLKDKPIIGKIDVPQERQHLGFNAYQTVIAESDVVLLCTPPHFRPLHLK